MKPFVPKTLAAAVIAWALWVVSASAVEWTVLEGAARGFPVLRDMTGKKLADGDFAQWIERSQLHVRIRYEFGGRSVEETAVFRQTPELIQDAWTMRELRKGNVFRQFEVNFRTGAATAQKRGEKELERWSEKVDVEPGRTFAGFGFTLAAKGLRKRLVAGEHVELKAVGFTPKPRVVSIDLSYAGADQLRIAQRTLKADRFVIHPKIPWFAELFVEVPDISIWLTPPPAGFLRFEGPLAEPNDPIIRIDGLPGG
jgi:hypothetical protein